MRKLRLSQTLHLCELYFLLVFFCLPLRSSGLGDFDRSGNLQQKKKKGALCLSSACLISLECSMEIVAELLSDTKGCITHFSFWSRFWKGERVCSDARLGGKKLSHYSPSSTKDFLAGFGEQHCWSVDVLIRAVRSLEHFLKCLYIYNLNTIGRKTFVTLWTLSVYRI